MGMSTPFIWRGIARPLTCPAPQADLEDQAPVIGVTVAGKSRAYALRAFQSMTDRVVNDLIQDIPVTVTYWPPTDLHRVFTSTQRGSPLELSIGGVVRGDMLLYLGKEFYLQKTGRSSGVNAAPLPYQDLPAVRANWNDWKQAHPDTDVYVGVAATTGTAE
jgi:hypothetical protein